MADLKKADEAIQTFMARTNRLITLTDRSGLQAGRQLTLMLKEADESLTKRLDTWIALNGGGEMRFSEASMLIYREQIRTVTELVEIRLAGLTADETARASTLALQRTMALITRLERNFTGVGVPLRATEAVIMRIRPSLMARHATSVARYGEAMITQMQRMMAQGLLEGVNQRQMVNKLQTGAFVSRRYWAWRIVRTEVAEAQNATAQESFHEARKELPGIQRKILAILDNRTAQDSLGVHGQVRALDKPFIDGAGRRYMRPPSRPNDRETLVPWRPHWPETAHSRPLTEAQQAEIWDRNEKLQAERARKRARARRRSL